MISSRALSDLTPEMQSLLVKFFASCMKAKIRVLITCTYRDNEEQNRLYAIGRTTPGKKVTNAKAGESAHNYRVAFDFVPLGEDGKPDWNDLEKFKKVGKIAEEVGLSWGGNFKSFPDMPHVQIRGFKIP